MENATHAIGNILGVGSIFFPWQGIGVYLKTRGPKITYSGRIVKGLENRDFRDLVTIYNGADRIFSYFLSARPSKPIGLRPGKTAADKSHGVAKITMLPDAAGVPASARAFTSFPAPKIDMPVRQFQSHLLTQRVKWFKTPWPPGKPARWCFRSAMHIPCERTHHGVLP